MQKNDRSYTFLLSHATKTTIYIRRVEVSKKLLHSGVAGLILVFGAFSFGAAEFLKNIPAAAEKSSEIAFTTQVSAQQSAKTQNAEPSQPDSIDYARPADRFAGSGGPADPPLSEAEGEMAALENQIRQIQTTSNPAFLPTVWAHLGKINNEFGFRRNPFGGRAYEFHAGLDIDGERGDSVLAPANGVVTKAGWQGGYGNLIEIDHGNGLTTRYGHLSKIEIQIGDAVQRGQVLGLIGSTGRSTGPHLHYELRVGDKPVNPRRLLPPEPFDLEKQGD